MKKLALITTHPIQYNAPWFRLLAERGYIDVKVFYTWSQVENENKFDPGFGKNVNWDIPLLDGYNYKFVRNISENPGSKNYHGIQNPTLIEEVESWRPDAILIFGWNFKSHLRAIRYFHRKIPILFRGDSHLLVKPRGLRKIIRPLILNFVYRHIDYALYVGAANKEYYQQSGLGKDRVRFVPHAVENSRFAGVEGTLKAARQWREKLEIEPSHLVFLFAGKFEEVKNPGLLLKVAKQFQKKAIGEFRDPVVHFVFVGSGPLEDELKKNQSERIHFVDFQNQQAMPALYHMADVFVLPSVSETWGLSVNEAMACSKPVIVSDKCGCAPDLIRPGINGYVFESENAQDLEAKLAFMVSLGKERLGAMGAEGHKMIQDWSFEKIVCAIEELMEKL